MIDDICSDAAERMQKSVESVQNAFKKIRTGRAHPSLLDSIKVEYYGADTPLPNCANIHVEDARTLTVQPWDKSMVPAIEKAIMSSDLGLNPSTAGTVIRVPMPMLTEESRKGFIKQARNEAEAGRVAIRNIRRDANGDLKEFLKEKEISEDEERRAEDEERAVQERIQKLTDQYISKIDEFLEIKEADLLEV